MTEDQRREVVEVIERSTHTIGSACRPTPSGNTPRVGTSNPCFMQKYADQISAAGLKGNLRPVRTMKPNAWGLYDMLCGGWHITADYKADNVREKQVDQKGPALGDATIQMGSTGPMHKSRGGYHYSFIRPDMHGAVGEDGSIWEGGAPIFRVVVEAGAPAEPAPARP